MASISKPAGQKNWEILFYFEGRKYHKSLRVNNKRDALELKRLIERRLAEGTFDPESMLKANTGVTRLKALVEQYTAYTRRRKELDKVTRYKYIHAAESLLDLFGDISLKQINRAFVSQEIQTVLASEYAPATVKSKMTGMRVMFAYALEKGYLASNPFSNNIPGYQIAPPVFYRQDDLDTYTSYWTDSRRPKWQQTYFMLILNTGIRRMALFNLLWSENVFLGESLLRVKDKGRYGGKWRVVPLNDSAIETLRSADRNLGEDRIFPGITIWAVDTAFLRFQERTGFSHNLHTTRSNYASHLCMSGKYTLFEVMQIMGWRSYETAKHYLAYMPDFVKEKRNAVNFSR